MDTRKDRLWRRALLPFLLAAQLGAGGCTAPLTPLPPPRSLGQSLEPENRALLTSLQSREAFSEPQGQLSLPTALSAALLNSPRLAAFDWQVRASEARALQAGLLPNPKLVVEGENFAGSGDFGGYSAGETTVFLGQLVELGGKRAKRRRVALFERELSGWNYEAARLDVLTKTTQRFVAALAAKERLALTSEILGISQESLQATKARVRAGAASSIEEARSEVAIATIEIERDRLRVELEAARQNLASSWAGSATFEDLEGDLALLRELPSLERITIALSDNPDLARWASEVSRREAAVELAQAGAIPDITAGLGVRHLNDTDDAALVFGVEIPIPLFDRNQGARAAALAEAHRARALRRNARLVLTRALIASHANALGAHGNARSLAQRVLPQAEEAYRRTEEAYRQGLFRLVDVLDAQRTLFSARTEYVNALEQFHTAAAELERLAGSSLEDLTNRSH
jgi:cobalt-zinc-cadmium efflux system outer membrane protein